MGFFLVFLVFAVCFGTVFESVTEQTSAFSALPLTRFAFGSCAKGKETDVFDVIRKWKPQLFLLAGDAVYNDVKVGPLPGMFRPGSLSDMKRNFDQRRSGPGFKRLTQEASLLTIWDDHDFGLNDADGTLSFKEESRKLFLEFAGEPKDSPRWNRNGIFQAYSFDSGRIKIIMLDVRFNRSHDDILGEEQWKWLNQEMADDVAKIKFLVSPIQVLVLDRPLQEKFSQQWKSFVRLAELISKTPGVIILSGDVHMSCSSRSSCGMAYNVTEFTSSGLTHSLVDNFWTSMLVPFADGILKSTFQLEGYPIFTGRSFGGVEVDWALGKVRLIMLDALSGRELQTVVVHIDDLKANGRIASFASCEKYEQQRFRVHWSEVLQIAFGMAGVFGIALGVLMYCQCARARRAATKRKPKGN